jgi:hypothetical protein
MKSMALPPGPLGGVAWLRRLDGGTALVPGRADDFFEQELGHPIGIVRIADGKEIQDTDEAAGANRRPDREDRGADDLPPKLGDENARMGEVDELAEQVTGSRFDAGQRHDALDIRDACGSDRVLHAVRLYL